MPKAKNASYKSKGGKKDSAEKSTLNPPAKGGTGSQTNEPYEQDAERRIGQFGGQGEPPIMNK